MPRPFVLAASLIFGVTAAAEWQWLSPAPPAIEDGTPVVAVARAVTDPDFTFDPSHPAAAVFEQTSIDAGEVLAGSPATFEFAVHNNGTGPLELLAKPHCGCTVAEYDRTVAPGGAGRICATLRTSKISGTVHKSIAVSTNDPQHRKLELALTATIVDPIHVELPPGQVIPLPLHQTTSTEFPVRIAPSASVRITGLTCDRSYVTAELVEPIDTDPKSPRIYRVRVRIGPDAPPGKSTAMLVLKTDLVQRPAVDVRLQCEKGIVAFPPTVHFGLISGNEPVPVSRSVVLRRLTKPFQIVRTSCGVPGLTLAQTELPEHAGYRLTLSCVARGTTGTHLGTMKIETDDPEQPMVELPVSYRILALDQGKPPVAASTQDQ